jgi:hypothetical protein
MEPIERFCDDRVQGFSSAAAALSLSLSRGAPYELRSNSDPIPSVLFWSNIVPVVVVAKFWDHSTAAFVPFLSIVCEKNALDLAFVNSISLYTCLFAVC